MKGIFISFEGIDGAGKTTILRLLEKYLKGKNLSVVSTYEPGDTLCGKKIRDILEQEENKLYSYTELLLYLADRAEHIKKVILPALYSSKIVICDRFFDSTIAYQGYGRGIDIDKIKMFDNFVRSSLLPELTILFDIEVEIGFKRKNIKLSEEYKLFFQRVRKGFLEIAKQEPQRIKIIDANRHINDVFFEVCRLVDKIIKINK